MLGWLGTSVVSKQLDHIQEIRESRLDHVTSQVTEPC
jgi:hypothetical protein